MTEEFYDEKKINWSKWTNDGYACVSGVAISGDKFAAAQGRCRGENWAEENPKWSVKIYDMNGNDILSLRNSLSNKRKFIRDIYDEDEEEWMTKEWKGAYGVVADSTRFLGEINSIAMDGNLVVAGGVENVVYLWDISKVSDKTHVEPIHILEGHKDKVNTVALMDDTIISGSSDGTVNIWNTKGVLLHTFSQFNHPVIDEKMPTINLNDLVQYDENKLGIASEKFNDSIGENVIITPYNAKGETQKPNVTRPKSDLTRLKLWADVSKVAMNKDIIVIVAGHRVLKILNRKDMSLKTIDLEATVAGLAVGDNIIATTPDLGKKVHIRNLEGSVIRTLVLHSKDGCRSCDDPDAQHLAIYGDRIVVGSHWDYGKTLTVWNINTGELLSEMVGVHEIQSVDICHGNIVACGGGEGSDKIFILTRRDGAGGLQRSGSGLKSYPKLKY